MKPYEFLDHTSEAKFRAYGETLEEVLENSAKAMFAIMCDPENVKSKITKTFEIEKESEDLKSLLFDFLDQLIILKDSESFLLHDIEVKIEVNKLSAVCKGDRANDYPTSGDVKAPTYSEMLVEQKKAGKTSEAKESEWMTQVVGDV